MTKKQLLMRLLPMAASLIILLVIAFSCSAFSGNEKVPTISNGSDVFATLGELEVTNEEVYNQLVDQFGAKELRQLIDYELLSNGPVNYIEMAMNDADFDIDEIVERSKYNGMTYEEARKELPEETLLEVEAEFFDRIIYNGYADMDDYLADLYLEHARGLYTKDQLLKAKDITMNDIAREYEQNYYTEACAISVRVDTIEEARNLLSEQGIFTDEEGLFAEEYTSEQILEAYVNVYNTVYGNKDDITYVDGMVLECGSEQLTYNFDELSETQPDIANIIFRGLDTNGYFNPDTLEEFLPYTNPIQVNSQTTNGVYMFYKVYGDNQNEFWTLYENLTEEEYEELLGKTYGEVETNEVVDELFQRLVQTRSDSYTYVSVELAKLLEEHEFTIYDKYLRYNFDSVYAPTIENEGSDSVVFSYVDYDGVLVEMSADDFFSFLDNHVAPVTVNQFNAKIALNDGNLYDEVITDEVVAETQGEVNSYKVQFQQNGFVEYGFDNSTLTWNEFIYAAFQYRSELELYNALLTSRVVEEFKIDLLTSDDIQEVYYDLMIESYESAFVLDVKHFLVYADNNENGAPDLTNEFNWTTEQTVLANELLDLLREKLTLLVDAEEVTIEDLEAIANEYKLASFITDESAENYSEWAKFKVAGLKLMVEDLGNVSQGQMVENFENELSEMYKLMYAEELFTLISSENVQTEFGYHLIYSDNYLEKADAYPEDDKVFPSRIDIQAFNDGIFENLSQETLIFIGNYYTPITNEYTERNELVLFDIARAELGTVEFTNPAYLEDYNKVIETNKAASER